MNSLTMDVEAGKTVDSFRKQRVGRSLMVIVNLQAARGQAAALRALLQQGRDFSLKAEGCEAFDLYQGQEDRFVLVQRWSSAEAHHAHYVKNIKESGHLDKVLSLTTKSMESAAYRAV